MADVFVSYAREDQARVEQIVKALESAGLSVWWDRRIPGGADFALDTERALANSAVCVACWTAASVSSRWVRDEATAAAEQGKLLPITLEGERPPMGLRQYQSIDLAGWSGDAGEPCFAALVDAVRRRVNKPAQEKQSSADRSIAVLPFVNLSGDSTCQNFCDAVGADIISLLARNKDLRVLARGASFTQRRVGETIAEIGRRLDVRYIVDGTIRRSGDMARITVDLVLSATGQLLWAGRLKAGSTTYLRCKIKWPVTSPASWRPNSAGLNANSPRAKILTPSRHGSARNAATGIFTN
jgi:adenylate cyclase